MPTAGSDVQSGEEVNDSSKLPLESGYRSHKEQTEGELLVRIGDNTTKKVRHVIKTKDTLADKLPVREIVLSPVEDDDALSSMLKTDEQPIKQDTKEKKRQRKKILHNGTVYNTTSDPTYVQETNTEGNAVDVGCSELAATNSRIVSNAEASSKPEKPAVLTAAVKNDIEVKKRKSPKKNKETVSRKRNVKSSVKSHLLTDFYPVRRSLRKTKSVLEKEEEDSIIDAIHTKCEDGLGIVEFTEKGRGVVAKRAFRKGSFIVEYAGELIDWVEAKKREKEYAKDTSVGCYMYYFIFENVNYCVDATAESGRLGRLLNHSRKNPNCKTKLVRVPNPKQDGAEPRLIIIAKQDIGAGEELTYDYGDRDKETLQSHPWLKLT